MVIDEQTSDLRLRILTIRDSLRCTLALLDIRYISSRANYEIPFSQELLL